MSEQSSPVADTSTDFPVGGSLIILVDDHHDAAPDHARLSAQGQLVTELLGEFGFEVDGTVICSGNEVEIRNALNTAVIGGVDLVVTIGGVGSGPRDITPEATSQILDHRIEGIEEAIRAANLAAGIVAGVVSRGVVGVSGSTLVANLPAGRKAIRAGIATLGGLAVHVLGELAEVTP